MGNEGGEEIQKVGDFKLCGICILGSRILSAEQWEATERFQICIWKQLLQLLAAAPWGAAQEWAWGGQWEDFAVIQVREMLMVSAGVQFIDLFIQQVVVELLCAGICWR